MDLSELGFSKEEVQARVIDGIIERLMSKRGTDEDGDAWYRDSRFKEALEARIQKGIDEAVGGIAERLVLPNVHAYIENLTLQGTNRWGEKQGQQTTFIEYLVKRAESYMTEEVNYEGKAKHETNGYSWSKSQTRIAHMVDKHLHYSIQTAMEAALKNANSAIVGGIEETVKIKLAEVAAKLKLDVKTK